MSSTVGRRDRLTSHHTRFLTFDPCNSREIIWLNFKVKQQKKKSLAWLGDGSVVDVSTPAFEFCGSLRNPLYLSKVSFVFIECSAVYIA